MTRYTILESFLFLGGFGGVAGCYLIWQCLSTEIILWRIEDADE